MKNKIFIWALPLTMFLITANDRKEEPLYKPVLMKREVLETSVTLQNPYQIKNPGKIYLYGQLVLLNEKYKGIHVIDNTDPKNPINKWFIRVPGCIDIAVKNNIIYADNTVDLIAVDISSLPEINVTSRLRYVLPEHTPPDKAHIDWAFQRENRPANTEIIEWIQN